MSRGRRLRRRLHNLRARSPHAPHLSASTLGHRRARTSSAIACLRQRITPRPGRLRSAQCSALRHSRESIRAISLFTFARRSQHPFKRRGGAPLCRGMSSRVALACVFLMSLAGKPRRRRKDASHRFLQPTFNYEHPTTVQLPSPQLALQRPPPRSSFGGFSPECLRERGVGPPFSNPAPGWVTLDGAPQASACPITFLFTLLS
jgi:hypothetical protein